MKFPVITASILLLFALQTHADVYMYKDRSGVTHFTDSPNHAGYRLILRSKKRTKASGRQPYNKSKFSSLVRSAAKRHRIDPDLLHAVIRAESSYNPNAVSRAGAVGLMQLMPATAKRYGVRNRRDPVDNVNGGAHYLRDLLKMFHSNVRLAVAAYNAGENAVIKYGRKVPPYRETREYVNRVLRFYRN